MSITTISLVKTWANASAMGTDRDTALTECVDAADKICEELCGVAFLQATRTVYFDGNGDQWLDLDHGHRYVTHPGAGTDAFVVKENGTTVTSVIGYTTTAGCVVAGANGDEVCRIYRSGGWCSGVQNIQVTYQAGWTQGNMPMDVVNLGNEVAWLLFQAPQWIGKANVSHQSGSVSVVNELSAVARETIERWRLKVL